MVPPTAARRAFAFLPLPVKRTAPCCLAPFKSPHCN
jgi:hypothetical protein